MATTAAQGASQTVTLEHGDFAALLNKEFKPKTDQAQEAVVSAVRTLAEQALSTPTSSPATPTAPSRR